MLHDQTAPLPGVRRTLLLGLLAVVALTQAPTMPRADARPATHGDVAGIAMGGPWTWAPPEQQAADLDLIAKSGASWVRVSFPWSSLQFAEDRYDWSVHDRIVGLAHERGLRVIANVAYTPRWAQPEECTSIYCAPRDPQEYADFLGTAVARYADYGVVAWEVWNEPNLQRFWRPQPDPEGYATLLEAAYAAAKEADPSVTVVSGGLAPSSLDTADGLTPLTFLERMYEAVDGEALDALGMHPYSYPRAPTDYHPTNTFTMLPRIHEVMRDHGDGDKQIWVTEFGYWTSPLGILRWNGSVTEREQAEYLVEAYEATGARSWLGPTIWYSVRDRGNDDWAEYRREANFGLIARDGSLKPAGRAFADLMPQPLPN